MKSRHLKLLVPFAAALAIALIATSLASAKGNFTTVVVMRLGTGELRIVHDPDLVGFFALSDFTKGSREVTNPGSTYADSYELTRVGEGEGGGLFAIDRVRYVPPGSSQLGYIFYEGLINGSSEYDGKWFPTTPAGDEVMKRIMTSTPSTLSTGVSPLAAGASALILLVAGFAAGTVYQRRRSRRPQRSGQATETSAKRAA